jgi:GTP-sensing pleiotropic transcriptional regulator CodY
MAKTAEMKAFEAEVKEAGLTMADVRLVAADIAAAAGEARALTVDAMRRGRGSRRDEHQSPVVGA